VFDSTNSILYAYYGGGWHMIDGHTTPISAVTTWANSVAESGALYTGPVPANTLTAGRNVVMRMWAAYQENLGGTDTLTLRVKFGTSTLFSVPCAAVGALKPIYLELMITCYATGVSPTGQIMYALHASVNGVPNDQMVAASGSADTTVANDVTVTAQWSAAHTTSIFTVTQAFLKFEN
jgi:hypothetical protein